MRPVITRMDSGPWSHPVEIVERKGIGHPDTMCDALAEELSRSLCRYYYERFGLVLHHNVDKGLIFAGRALPAFGGGQVLEPMEIFLVGRATMEFKGVKVPVEEIAIEGARAWIRRNFHALDPEKDIKIKVLIRPGSQELVELFLRQKREGVAMSNDTSCGIGFAPLTSLEELVFNLEHSLNRPEFHEKHPQYGQDIKVMGVRLDERVELTVACAMVGRFIKDLDLYRQAVAGLEKEAMALASSSFSECRVLVNTADDLDSGSIYLTVTGTSAEAGDDGEVGRGNRANGLITPCRPMNMEAVAGKNPINHVGKIYNIVARLIAERIRSQIEPVEQCCVILVSRIGAPVSEPAACEVRIGLSAGGDSDPTSCKLPSHLCDDIADIVNDELKGADRLWKRLLYEDIMVY